MQKFFTVILCLFSSIVFCQTVVVEGYCYGEGNRGYLSQVYVRIQHPETKETLAETYTNMDGFFEVSVPQLKSINVLAKKSQYKMKELDLKLAAEKMFVKIEMSKEPGYLFEVTLADKREAPGSPTAAITGALIEVYNNTERKPELVIKDSKQPEFDINFKKGNHYTILIRKPGYLSKRMEAYVDVDGCILCFEGVGRVQPGVAENLTDENAAGVLLANVELEPIFTGKTLEIENIYYGLGKWNITRKAQEQLRKVILLMEDNPNLTMELGSHTDSRGNNDFNKELSEKRAKASVDYIVKNGNINKARVISHGYGEQVILNKCVDGVVCTEEEHSINRRTELKILGIGNLGAYKPLAQMKEEEFLEQEVLNQEEVKVTGDETLEQVLEAKAASSSSEVVPIVPQVDADGEEPLLTEPEELQETKKDIAYKVKEEQMEAEPLLPAEKQMQYSDKEKTLKLQQDLSAREEDAVTTSSAPHAIHGVKIVIHKSDKMLSADSEIVKTHEKLEIYLADDSSIWYMLGGYEDKAAAQSFLDSFVKITYPDAYVVTFEDGKLR